MSATSHDFDALLATKKPILLDGAWATTLTKRGYSGSCPEMANLNSSDRVFQIAWQYVAAGSQIILTNTFGASRVNLCRHNLDQLWREINQAGASIARNSAQGKALVFGSIGPSFDAGRTPENCIADIVEHCGLLAECGVSGLALETIMNVEVACYAIRAILILSLPIVASITLKLNSGELVTHCGMRPEDALLRLEDAGAAAIGANCGAGFQGLPELCSSIKKRTTLPIWMKPNLGLPKLNTETGGFIYTVSPEEFAEDCARIVNSGATLIGGCCGSGPEHIAALATQLQLS